MRKLNISLLLLVFCLSGSLSCRSLSRPKTKKQTAKAQPRASEPGLSASDFFQTETQRALEASQAQQVPAPTRTIPGPTVIPGPSTSGLLAVSAPGSSVISRTYPWPECGPAPGGRDRWRRPRSRRSCPGGPLRPRPAGPCGAAPSRNPPRWLPPRVPGPGPPRSCHPPPAGRRRRPR